jgi:hypothetical protein
MSIGEASCETWNEKGLAVWTLRIDGKEVPGEWAIVDRQFKPVH